MKPRVQTVVLTNAERLVIDAIVSRAQIHFADRDERDIKMDLIATHLDACPLRLNELLDAPDVHFIHDIVGIERHLDHATFKFRDGFTPRYALPAVKARVRA
jgi:hypothetical protein